VTPYITIIGKTIDQRRTIMTTNGRIGRLATIQPNISMVDNERSYMISATLMAQILRDRQHRQFMAMVERAMVEIADSKNQ
jgi:hypothetical protein